MYLTRREMNEAADRRNRDELFSRPSDPPISTDAVTNTLNAIRREVRELRQDMEDVTSRFDGDGGLEDLAGDIRSLESRVDDLEP